MKREKKIKMKVCVFDYEFDVYLPKEKEQLYLSAAKYVDKKIDAYKDAFVRVPLPQKSTQEVLLMAMFDIAVRSVENKFRYKLFFLFQKLKNALKNRAFLVCNVIRNSLRKIIKKRQDWLDR